MLIEMFIAHNMKKQSLFGIVSLSNFYIVEYCEIFKIAFSKILDFLRRSGLNNSNDNSKYQIRMFQTG